MHPELVPFSIAQPLPTIKRRCVAETMSGDGPGGERQEKRIAKRESAVAAIKRTPAYILTQDQNKEGGRAQTPDPRDEKTSKRSWEKSVMQWRSDLRAALHRIHVEMSSESGE